MGSYVFVLYYLIKVSIPSIKEHLYLTLIKCLRNVMNEVLPENLQRPDSSASQSEKDKNDDLLLHMHISNCQKTSCKDCKTAITKLSINKFKKV